MITLNQETIALIKAELESIPQEYQKPFNSMHEGLGVIREEYKELEEEIFFGKKKSIEEYSNHSGLSKEDSKHWGDADWKINVRKEAVQVAAMAIRIIQELT